MKNLTWKTRVLIAISAVAVLSVTSAYAQTNCIRAYIPFQFLAGTKLLPAGEYQLEVATPFNRVVLRQIDGAAGLYLSPHPTQRATNAPQPGMLVFHKYGKNYFLWRMWSPGQSQGYQLPASKAEREMARMERARPASQTVSIGAGPE